jgi:predicted nucleotidyltransferase component of viral defense system
MIKPQYKAQVDLLLDVLPYVAKEKCFALKGGTAINMFVWDMPRLSVDIDLTYIDFDERNKALAIISESLLRIKEDILKNIPNIQVEASGITPIQKDKLLCVRKGVKIKVEVNITMRGIIKPLQIKQTMPSVSKEFEKFVSIQIVSNAELFGGKICAALDRQHPRDLFDIHQLFDSGGITEEIKEGFIVALISHNRPMHELLKPNFQNQKEAFAGQFSGMALKPFSYEDFKNTRYRLVKDINNSLNDNDKNLLLSIKSGNPNWALSKIKQLQNLPAIKWKLENIEKLLNQNPKQHSLMLKKLEQAVS